MAIVFLLLGSNLGDRSANLSEARLHISRLVGEIITVSSVYKTAAWGNVNQADFYNQVIEVQPFKSPTDTLTTILGIEETMGRVRKIKWGSRLIDIDILLWGKEIIHTANLVIPHPQLQNRRFVLIPLVELTSEFIHPVLNKPINQLLAECTDSLTVEKLSL